VSGAVDVRLKIRACEIPSDPGPVRRAGRRLLRRIDHERTTSDYVPRIDRCQDFDGLSVLGSRAVRLE
jgi:hypothetical protein